MALAENLKQTSPILKERAALVPQSKQLGRTPKPSLEKGKGTELSVQITQS